MYLDTRSGPCTDMKGSNLPHDLTTYATITSFVSLKSAATCIPRVAHAAHAYDVYITILPILPIYCLYYLYCMCSPPPAAPAHDVYASHHLEAARSSLPAVNV